MAKWHNKRVQRTPAAPLTRDVGCCIGVSVLDVLGDGLSCITSIANRAVRKGGEGL